MEGRAWVNDGCKIPLRTLQALEIGCIMSLLIICAITGTGNLERKPKLNQCHLAELLSEIRQCCFRCGAPVLVPLAAGRPELSPTIVARKFDNNRVTPHLLLESRLRQCLHHCAAGELHRQSQCDYHDKYRDLRLASQ